MALHNIIRMQDDGGPVAQANTRRRVSLIVPLYNEEASIAVFLEKLCAVLAGIGPHVGFDILFVNDGSRDGTERLILAAAAQDPRIGLINLSRNFGKEAALFAGLRHATGDAVIPIDVDLQDPPDVIAEMIARWLAGAKVVNARRASRDHDSRLKRMTAKALSQTFEFPEGQLMLQSASRETSARVEQNDN